MMAQHQSMLEAAADGDLRKIQALVSQDPLLLRTPDSYNRSPLIWASRKGHVKAVDWICDHLTAQEKELADGFGNTALHIACREGYLEIVKVLLAKGVNPGIRNRYGWTSLIASSSKGHLEICRSLLAHGGSDVNTRWGSWGYTALHQACQYGHEEVVQMLLQAGADPTLVDKKGRTTLKIALSSEGHHHQGMIQMVQAALREPERCYNLVKARHLADVAFSCLIRERNEQEELTRRQKNQARDEEEAHCAAAARLEVVDQEKGKGGILSISPCPPSSVATVREREKHALGWGDLLIGEEEPLDRPSFISVEEDGDDLMAAIAAGSLAQDVTSPRYRPIRKAAAIARLSAAAVGDYEEDEGREEAAVHLHNATLETVEAGGQGLLQPAHQDDDAMALGRRRRPMSLKKMGGMYSSPGSLNSPSSLSSFTSTSRHRRHHATTGSVNHHKKAIAAAGGASMMRSPDQEKKLRDVYAYTTSGSLPEDLFVELMDMMAMIWDPARCR